MNTRDKFQEADKVPLSEYPVRPNANHSLRIKTRKPEQAAGSEKFPSFRLTYSDKTDKQEVLNIYVKKHVSNTDKSYVTFHGPKELSGVSQSLSGLIADAMGYETLSKEANKYGEENARYNVGKNYKETLDATKNALNLYVRRYDDTGRGKTVTLETQPDIFTLQAAKTQSIAQAMRTSLDENIGVVNAKSKIFSYVQPLVRVQPTDLTILNIKPIEFAKDDKEQLILKAEKHISELPETVVGALGELAIEKALLHEDLHAAIKEAVWAEVYKKAVLHARKINNPDTRILNSDEAAAPASGEESTVLEACTELSEHLIAAVEEKLALEEPDFSRLAAPPKSFLR